MGRIGEKGLTKYLGYKVSVTKYFGHKVSVEGKQPGVLLRDDKIFQVVVDDKRYSLGNGDSLIVFSDPGNQKKLLYFTVRGRIPKRKRIVTVTGDGLNRLIAKEKRNGPYTSWVRVETKTGKDYIGWLCGYHPTHPPTLQFGDKIHDKYFLQEGDGIYFESDFIDKPLGGGIERRMYRFKPKPIKQEIRTFLDWVYKGLEDKPLRAFSGL